MAIARIEDALGAPRGINPAERLIVALDVSSREEASDLVDRLDGIASFFKIGLQLQLTIDQKFIESLVRQGKRIFLDYKYFDIGRTVKEAVIRAADIGVSFLTVHGNGGIIEAAIEGRGSSGMKVLSVTALTSLDEHDIREMGFDCSVERLVLHRALKAKAAGCDGIIASGQEAEAIRRQVGDGLLVVVPGIRPDGEPIDDQKRVTTPHEAITAGADYLVVGRPIYRNRQPAEAAQEIIAEMSRAFAQRGF